MGRVLVVEDYPPLAKVIAIGVRRAGHEATRVGSVQRAMAEDGDFDCTVLDIDLPDGDGVELANQLLSQRRTRHVVFYTACRDTTVRVDARRYGPVVDKSEGLDELLKAIATELEGSNRAARAAGGGDIADVSMTGRSGVRPRVR